MEKAIVNKEEGATVLEIVSTQTLRWYDFRFNQEPMFTAGRRKNLELHSLTIFARYSRLKEEFLMSYKNDKGISIGTSISKLRTNSLFICR